MLASCFRRSSATLPICCNARALAASTSCRVQPRRIAQSWSEHLSSTDMTKTKRSKGRSPRTALISARSDKISPPLFIVAEFHNLSPPSGRGLTIRSAFWMIALRAQERAHSLKTRFRLVAFSRPSTKHCSAFLPSPASNSESRYKLFISSSKIVQKSPAVAYSMSFMLATWFALNILASVSFRNFR